MTEGDYRRCTGMIVVQLADGPNGFVKRISVEMDRSICATALALEGYNHQSCLLIMRRSIEPFVWNFSRGLIMNCNSSGQSSWPGMELFVPLRTRQRES
jgi:hypothetical protein